jgi:hypothetical protein
MNDIDDDPLPPWSEEEVQEKLEEIAGLIADLFPCSAGWSYSLDLWDEEGNVVGIDHSEHTEDDSELN